MAKLIYSAICSLDGYVGDEQGNFDWAAPDAEVHEFVNELERPIGTYLYGRRMYEVMKYWETHDTAGDDPMGEYTRIWQAAEKVVYSRTLTEVTTAKTRLEGEFNPDAVRALKDSAAADISVGGPELAAQALAAGLVDECHVFLTPVLVGSGNAAFRGRGLTGLELVDERRFGSGVVYIRYRTR